MGLSEKQKQNIKNAMASFNKKNDPNKVTRKNNAPEKEAVKLILDWCKSQSWSVTVIEAKAVFNRAANRYMTSQVGTKGFCDIVGNDNEGRAVFIEAKALGKRATVKQHQIDFLKSKIESNCFACVTDSPENLKTQYVSWLQSLDKKSFLISQLPKKKSRDNENDLLFT